MHKVLITGCNGYIGSRLASFLKGKCEVVGIARQKTDASFPVHVGDVRDRAFVSSVMKEEGVTDVFHLAALLKNSDAEETWDVNVLGTASVADAFARSDAQKIIFSSSGKVYGKVDAVPTPETYPLNATSPYGRSKIEAEKALRGMEGKQTVILRQTYLYGRGMKQEFLVPTIINHVKTSSVVMLRNADVKRDFIHVDDLLQLYYFILRKKMPQRDVYNVSYGSSISLRELAMMAGKILNKNVEVKSLRIREENEEELLDATKIRKLGWAATVNYEEGMRRCIV
ncbi:MAG: NAD(P)-dependent oxidoreductase [Candidatus Aenigmarchaeota archaeon]|nr:NAD(P)-dependent oxidoreductase [Candidatus Aenigmarchaeota archaeon]